MSEPETVQVGFTPTAGRSGIEIYRAVRDFLERKMAAKGLTLHPAWYKDGPEDMPHLYNESPR
jgi:hypothetical protein